jgi:hypothetical protein
MRLRFVMSLCAALIANLDDCILAQENDSLLVLDNFEELQNGVGGYRNGFSKSPSSTICRRVRRDHEQGHCFRIKAERTKEGFCGAWIHLHNFRDTRPEFLDASQWKYLTFCIRGDSPAGDVNIRLADEEWIRKEDAITIGPASKCLELPIGTQWQEVAIPLADLQKLDLKRLGALSFEFSKPGNFTIWVDDLCLKQSLNDDIPETPIDAVRVAHAAPQRAMWVWSTESIINDPLQTDQLLKSCESERIGHLWIQLPYRIESRVPASELQGPTSASMQRNSNTEAWVRVQNADRLRAFILQAHRQRIEVHALDGSPEFAVRSGHTIPLAVVDAVVEFNSLCKQTERFDGVHFDNEPYLLLGWSNRALREEIIHDLLSLNVACQEKARSAGLKFGVDVPFWWNALDSETGEAAGVVTFQGSRKAATHHCIDQLDNVGIMNYRDQADGADGMLAHGIDILEYADDAAHALVFMGVETFRYEPQPVWFALGLQNSEFAIALKDRGRHLALLSRLHGLRLHQLRTGNLVHIGVELPGLSATVEERQQAESAIRILAREFGHFSGGEDDQSLLAIACEEAERSPEWQDWSLRPIHDAGAGATFSGFVTTRLMPSKVTFADDSMATFIDETNFAEETFGRYSSYSGLAIHSWESYRQKLPNLADSLSRSSSSRLFQLRYR